MRKELTVTIMVDVPTPEEAGFVLAEEAFAVDHHGSPYVRVVRSVAHPAHFAIMADRACPPEIRNYTDTQTGVLAHLDISGSIVGVLAQLPELQAEAIAAAVPAEEGSVDA